MLVNAKTAHILTRLLPDSNRLSGRKGDFYVSLPTNFATDQNRIGTALLNAPGHMFAGRLRGVDMFGNRQGITGIVATGAD